MRMRKRGRERERERERMLAKTNPFQSTLTWIQSIELCGIDQRVTVIAFIPCLHAPCHGPLHYLFLFLHLCTLH